MTSSSGAFSKSIAKTRRGRKAVLKREPQVVEAAKQTVFVRGPSSSQLLGACVADLAAIKAPLAVKYSRKSDIRPFDDVSSILFYAHKSDAGLFAHTSSNKKRPSNLTLGRIFNGDVLDMFEFGVSQFAAMRDFKSAKPQQGGKPMILLDGAEWEQSGQMRIIANFLVDFFQGAVVSRINLAGLDHVISLAVRDNVIYFRQFIVAMKKSGAAVPRVELTEMGPSFELKLRRSIVADDDVRKEALRIPAQLFERKRKNVTTNVFGEKIGRIHMPRQELSSMQIKKVKALKEPANAAKKRRLAARAPLGQDASNDV
jgi:ribosome production factor 2